MKLKVHIFCLLIGLASGVMYGQDSTLFKVHSIDLHISSMNPDITNFNFNDLKENGRFGNLLEIPNGDTISVNGAINVNSTNISISLKPRDSLSRYHVTTILGAEVIQSTWGNWSKDDTTSISLTGRYENFLLGMGYLYELKRGRIFKITTGLQAFFSFPVSSVTMEEINTNGDLEESKLFGHKRVGFRSSLPVNFYLRIFKPVSLKFALTPSVNTFQLDGIKRTRFRVGNEIGLRFYLK